MSDRDKPTVLVVDDVPENIDVLTSILSLDYRVKAAVSGERALDIARSDDPPDLILLDVVMPGMDGLEVCRRLKENERSAAIPVVFVTARDGVADETSGFEAGGIDYITKPVSPPLVRARLRTHLDLYDQNRALERQVRERTAALQEALDDVSKSSLETIMRLARAAEYRDDDTGVHVIRMSHYCATVARKLGLPDDEVRNLLHAAPMHDVGKIGIPDGILLKPGRLDDEEWQVMRRHCKMGQKILAGSTSPVIRLGEVIAMSHHEKWDGSGYPRLLKGQQIPLVGRIAAVCDVFDAVSSDRPYKKAFPLDRSLSIIHDGHGSHFDPQVVEAFFAAESEILAIREQFRGPEADGISVMLANLGGRG